MSFIQNLFTSRDNNANAETYVGQPGRIWWDPTTNSFYYSDGSTPGGIPVGSGGNPFNQTLNTYNDVEFANLTLTGNITIANTSTVDLGNLTITDQTISGTVDGRDISLSPVGTGTLRTLNGIGVYQGSFSSTPLFSVSTTGVVSTLVPNATSYLGALEVIGNPAGDTVAPQNYGVMVHTTGVPDVPARIYNDGVNTYGVYINRRYNGTSAAPTGVLQNQIMGRLGATPYVDNGGAGIFPSISTTRVDFIATEDQTTTSQGSKIQILATQPGETTPTVVIDLAPDNIILHGNLIPDTTNIFSLGNNTNKWDSVYIGPSSLFIEDTTLGTDAELTVNNGALLINGPGLIQVGNMQMTTDGISLVTANTGSNIQVGASGDTGYMQINMPGIKFRDGSIQTTAAIPLTQKGNALGVVPLNASTKIDPIYLPAGGVTFKGVWNASTNSPTLADGTGTVGDEYVVGVAGTRNLGSGSQTFNVGDFVLYTSGNIWVDVPTGSSGVQSFNSRTGVVTLQSSDVTGALSNSSITNNFLASPNVTVTTGQGLSGGQVVPLGGSITLLNTGVISAIAGTGVAVSAATGNVTFSIGQAVGTANSVQFLAVSATQTVQATGNVTGGNLTTAGRVVATGNIVTSGNVVTPGTTINSGIATTGNVSATGNVTGANLFSAGVITATGNITGGNIRTTGQVSATGNITAGNLTVAGISNLNSNANVKITGGSAGQSLITDGLGNLTWQTPQAGNVNIINGSITSNATIDFSYNSTTLIYLPTGNVNLTLQNYTAGHQARVMIRFATNYPILTGLANAAQSSEGLTTIPISGGGGHNTRANTTVQLLYTCFDSTAGNCYMAATYF